MKIFSVFVIILSIYFLTSCSNYKREGVSQINTEYHITTNFSLIKGGKSVETITAKDGAVDLTLKITYRSNVPFILEIGMTDNYKQIPFVVKDTEGFKRDTVFTVNMPETEDALSESLIEIQIPKLSAENHDILFFVHNKTKSENKSIRSYDFIRLFVDAGKDVSDKLLKDEYKVPFTSEEMSENTLELKSVFEKGRLTGCELKYNIFKIYEGEHFRPEYENNSNQPFPFLILALQNGKTVETEASYFAWSETSLGESGSVKFDFKKQVSEKFDLTIITIPYPFKNPENLERYQLIAYHGISYYRHDFNIIKTETF